MRETLVIAGAGQAAGQASISLRQYGYDGNIVIVGDEQFAPYQRPPLSKKFLAGELAAKRLFLRPATFYASHDVELRLGTRIDSIDRAQHEVLTRDGQSISYNKLLLATGSRVRELPVPGVNLDGVHYLRNISDVQAIQASFVAGRKLVIVGAGYIGLEVAAVAVQRGLEVTVLETEQRAMNRVVAPEISAFFERVHEEAGVQLEFGQMVEAFDGTASVSEVVCTSGNRYPADFCIIGIGILPNEEIAAAAELACDNGIVVDAYCRTSDEDILAAGDCTRHPNGLLGMKLRLESVHNAIEQGKTAAATISGTTKAYNQIPWFWSDQYDLKLQIVGLNKDYDQLVMRGDPESRSFACFYLQKNRLLAVDAINSPREFMLAKKLIKAGARMDPEAIADTSTNFKSLAIAALAATVQE